MKNKLFFSLLAATVLAFTFTGCYTQFVVKERAPAAYNAPDYSETYTDSTDSGPAVVNNYYYDDPGYRYGSYFHYYYPTRMSFMWSAYYDPFWDWCYTPYFGYSSWGYGSWYGYGYPYSGYYYGNNHGGWNNHHNTAYQGRIRTAGPTRTMDRTRLAAGSTRSLAAPTSVVPANVRTRSSEVFQRAVTRSRERDNAAINTRSSSPFNSNNPAMRLRDRNSHDRSTSTVPSSTRTRSGNTSTSSTPSGTASPAPSNSGRSGESTRSSGSGNSGSSGRSRESSGSSGSGSGSRGNGGGSGGSGSRGGGGRSR
jgi:hypothetical protein